METFTTSLDRMRNHKEAVMKLSDAMAFLSNSSVSLHPRDFFAIDRPWLKELRSELPDYDLFAQGLHGQNEYLLELERVSIGVRPVVPGPLVIHPLWVECIQQRAEHSGRLRWLRQILLLCHASYVHDPEKYRRSIEPFVQNAALIATRFDIPYRDLCENDDTWSWFQSCVADIHEEYADSAAPSVRSNRSAASALGPSDIEEYPESPGASSRSQEDDATHAKKPAHSTGETEQPSPLVAASANDTTTTSSNQISILHAHCKATATSFASSNPEKPSEEAFTTQLQKFLGLLQRLRAIIENIDVRTLAQDEKYGCLGIYDLLIQMAPAFRSRNARIVELLRGKREEFLRMVGEGKG